MRGFSGRSLLSVGGLSPGPHKLCHFEPSDEQCASTSPSEKPRCLWVVISKAPRLLVDLVLKRALPVSYFVSSPSPLPLLFVRYALFIRDSGIPGLYLSLGKVTGNKMEYLNLVGKQTSEPINARVADIALWRDKLLLLNLIRLS